MQLWCHRCRSWKKARSASAAPPWMGRRLVALATPPGPAVGRAPRGRTAYDGGLPGTAWASASRCPYRGGHRAAAVARPSSLRFRYTPQRMQQKRRRCISVGCVPGGRIGATRVVPHNARHALAQPDRRISALPAEWRVADPLMRSFEAPTGWVRSKGSGRSRTSATRWSVIILARVGLDNNRETTGAVTLRRRASSAWVMPSSSIRARMIWVIAKSCVSGAAFSLVRDRRTGLPSSTRCSSLVHTRVLTMSASRSSSLTMPSRMSPSDA